MLNNENIGTMDINILLSIVNMKLRDNYPSIEALCYDMDISEGTLINRLNEDKYIYQKSNNQFIKK
ncbi:protein of unknown function [Clostridium cavendishii DSM 21758]|uniref:DUF4250 domain-containing protein n=1 Tax=Clostridium cavendishii DSM 21758 TaxID=1121302 RepID=A0A1M6CWS0_9CLOT|nr:DUF4250 domain-containing protein [Clostridium cavendishii]SHI65409.1 protein of unknown function [Clostridium cavendishii DSM 21758]